MRTSFTPPTNFSKVSVNKATSLQQRQGMVIPKKVKRQLLTAIGTDQAWILKSLEEHDDKFRLAICSSVFRGGVFLEVRKDFWTFWRSKTAYNNHMSLLKELRQALPGLAEKYPANG